MNATPSYTAKSPYCDHQLDPATAVEGWVTCECGHRSDARWVNELGWLQLRSSWVAERINNGEPWFDSRAGAPAEKKESRTPQLVLYILGGVSLVTAVAVFLALNWDLLQPMAKAGSLLGVACVFAASALLTRKNLVGFANTNAVISSVVAAMALYLAPGYGLLDSKWAEPTRPYLLGVTLAIGIGSGIVGWLSKVAGGLAVVAPAVLASSTLLLFGLGSNYTPFDGWQLSAGVPLFTLCILALDRYGSWLSRREHEWRVVDVISAMFALSFTPFLVAGWVGWFGDESLRFWHAGALALSAALFAHAAFRWRSDPDRNPFAAFPHRATGIAAVVSASAALQQALLAAGSGNRSLAQWLVACVTAVLGALLFNLRLRRLPAFISDAAVAALWVFGFTGTADFSQEQTSYPIIAYFGILAAAGVLRWFGRWSIAGLVVACVAGFGAITGVVNELYAERISGPEAVMLPTSAWLFFLLISLRMQRPKTNTIVWLGIPLAAALIPSATVAVSMIDAREGVESLNWVRFWTVLAASLLFILIGSERRLAGPLVVGAIAYVFIAVPQMWVDLALPFPRWVLLAVMGLLLIGFAARYERLQRLRKQTGSWGQVFR